MEPPALRLIRQTPTELLAVVRPNARAIFNGAGGVGLLIGLVVLTRPPVVAALSRWGMDPAEASALVSIVALLLGMTFLVLLAFGLAMKRSHRTARILRSGAEIMVEEVRSFDAPQVWRGTLADVAGIVANGAEVRLDWVEPGVDPLRIVTGSDGEAASVASELRSWGEAQRADRQEPPDPDVSE